MGKTVTGPVTVLFTDVEGSTELHTRLGDHAARDILREHERLVRQHVEGHGGWEVKALGDGFMVAFSSTRSALACAVAIQTALEGGRVRVRMGLNAGEVTEERQDIFGAAVAAAARIAAKAGGGEILAADVVRQLAGVVPGLRFSDRGTFELKGFPEPFRLHEVLWRQDAPEFRILGPLEVVAAGKHVNVGGNTPKALLAMLVLHLGEVVTTDVLMEGLWGDRLPPSATNSLHSHLSRLRRVVAGKGDAESGPRVVRQGAGYVLEAGSDRVDARRFEHLVEAGRRALVGGDSPAGAAALRQALALWRGPPLADFANWSFAQTEAVRLEELRLAATEELVEAELALGSHGALVSQLESLVAAHPLRERLWGQLMVALYRSGRQAEALRAYQRVRDILVEELGIEPGPALRQLEEQILLQRPELAGPFADAPPLVAAPGPIAALPRAVGDVFVGRRRELALLDESLADAGAGHGRLVLVEGEAGIGKTALAERFAAHAQGARAQVCFGRAWEDEGAPPFWPWVEVVRSRLEVGSRPVDPMAVDLGQLLPEAAPPAGPTTPADPAQARFRLFEAVARCLIGEGPDPRVVVLENVHGTDSPSLQLLLFLTRRLAGAHLLLVVTHRPPDDARSPLAEALTELAREPATRRLTLGALGEDDVARFLQATLGESVPASVVASLQRRAEGHAFFLTEMVRLLRSEGRLDEPEALRAHTLEMPQSVTEMIGRRLAALSDDAARVLGMASVIGREFDLRLLEHVAPLSEEAVLDAVEEAAGAKLVEELSGAAIGYRFGHALIREALYERQSALRRRRLHQHIADAIEAGVVGPPEARFSELAYHRCASATEGEADQAVAAATRAADAAAGRLAYEEAARLYRLGLDTLERCGGDPAQKGGLLVALGDAEVRAGDVSSARVSLDAAAAIARAEADPDLLARVALCLGGGFEARLVDPELVALLEEALAVLPSDSLALHARLLARLAMALHLDDPLERRAPLSEKAIEVARTAGDPATLAYVLSARFFALWGPGHAAERLQAATETLQLADQLGNRELALDGLTWTIMELLGSGDRPGLDTHLARHARLAEELRHPLHRYYAEMLRASVAAMEGRFAEAEEGAERAYVMGEHINEGSFPRRCALLFAIWRDKGRLRELAEDVERILARYPPAFTRAWRTWAAHLWLELGEEAPARDLLAEAAEACFEFVVRDRNWHAAMAALTEMCVEVGEPWQAAALYELLRSEEDWAAVIPFAGVYRGSMARPLGLLATVLGEWGAAEGHFAAAEAVHFRMRAWPLLARTRYDWARMLLRRDEAGDGERAAALLGAALETAQELGMARLADEVGAVPAGARLRPTRKTQGA